MRAIFFFIDFSASHRSTARFAVQSFQAIQTSCGPSSGRNEGYRSLHRDFGGTADPGFQSTGRISKVIRTVGELNLLWVLLVMAPVS